MLTLPFNTSDLAVSIRSERASSIPELSSTSEAREIFEVLDVNFIDDAILSVLGSLSTSLSSFGSFVSFDSFDLSFFDDFDRFCLELKFFDEMLNFDQITHQELKKDLFVKPRHLFLLHLILRCSRNL